MSFAADLTQARAALDAARAVFGAYDRTPAPTLWAAAASVLQAALARPTLHGQALVAEARRAGLLMVADAHALVELASLADRQEGAASTEGERILVREAWMALQHAVPDDDGPTPAVSAASSYAPPPLRPAEPQSARASTAPPRPRQAVPGTDDVDRLSADDEVAVIAPRRRVPAWAILLTLILVVLGGAGGWWWFAGRHARAYTQAVDAYQRGSRESARVAFARLARATPDDARPLVFLGRIAREEQDLARSRQFLTTAVRVDPASALAARELAATMLADAQPEIARRFYVRAIELDPRDRTAQGFLACALTRLGRLDEAQRWAQRAGTGDWSPCLQPAAPPAGVSTPPASTPPRAPR
ncbi:MAG: hypothetical protein LCH84_04810 [Gemmatimonadetes bacterium]|nr:hypothetical protein [Gemmatimonadota bacterium]